MRICPFCHSQIKRSIIVDKSSGKRQCRECNHLVFFSKKNQVIPYADKECVDSAVEILAQHVSSRDDAEKFPDYSYFTSERLFAYDLLSRSKVFLERNNLSSDISYQDFFIGLLKYILSIPWWAEHIESLLMLRDAISQYAKEFLVEQRRMLRQRRFLTTLC